MLKTVKVVEGGVQTCRQTNLQIYTLIFQVKLKDTEVQHLQWELSRRELERVSLTDTVTSLSARLEELERAMTGHSELQGQYDALLQMYGEKLEECQELRMDLQDVKEMYKAQVRQLKKCCATLHMVGFRMCNHLGN